MKFKLNRPEYRLVLRTREIQAMDEKNISFLMMTDLSSMEENNGNTKYLIRLQLTEFARPTQNQPTETHKFYLAPELRILSSCFIGKNLMLPVFFDGYEKGLISIYNRSIVV